MFDWLDENKEYAYIRNQRTNKLICKIQAPQKLLLSLGSMHQVWKHPEQVEEWAWRQALTNSYQFKLYRENPICRPADFRCLCLGCGQETVRMIFNWQSLFAHLFHKNFTFEGFACTNPNCNMHEVIVPLKLLKHLDEIPNKYLPVGLTVSPPTKNA